MLDSGRGTQYLPAALDAQAIAHLRTGLIDATKIGKDLHRLMRLRAISETQIESLFEEMQT